MVGPSGPGEATENERLEALSYLVEALIIGQWARSRNPLARAQADIDSAKARLDQSPSSLSTGAQTEVYRILKNSLGRLRSEIQTLRGE